MQFPEWSGVLPERATWPRHRHRPGTVHARSQLQLHRLRPTRDHEVVLDGCDSRTARSSMAAADRPLAWLAVHVASDRQSASVRYADPAVMPSRVVLRRCYEFAHLLGEAQDVGIIPAS